MVEKAGDDDRFTPVMTAFLEKSTGDVASLASGMERMRDGLMELSRFLGDDVRSDMAHSTPITHAPLAPGGWGVACLGVETCKGVELPGPPHLP